MPSFCIRIASRKSPLALWQAHHVGQCIQKHWPHMQYEIVPIITTGDRFLQTSLQSMGGKGLFVKELEEGLLRQEADIAVHSMKDMPFSLPLGLSIAAILARDNPCDALLTHNKTQLQTLEKGSIVGTASLRRQAQILSLRPDLQVKMLRGNVGTRIEKLQKGEYHAILLAAAGLERLGLEHFIQEYLSPALFLPACAQGALGVECLRHREDILALLTPLHHAPTALCIQTERTVNTLLGGSCHLPLAVFCHFTSPHTLFLQAKVWSPDGRICIQAQQTGEDHEAETLAHTCAKHLLAQGAEHLLRPL